MVVCGKECGLVWMTYGLTKLSHTSVLEIERERERRKRGREWWKWASPRRGWGSYCKAMPVLHWSCLNHKSHRTVFSPSGSVCLIVLLFFSDLSMDFKSLCWKLTSFSAQLKIIMLLRGRIMGWKFKEGALLCFFVTRYLTNVLTNDERPKDNPCYLSG